MLLFTIKKTGSAVNTLPAVLIKYGYTMPVRHINAADIVWEAQTQLQHNKAPDKPPHNRYNMPQNTSRHFRSLSAGYKAHRQFI